MFISATLLHSSACRSIQNSALLNWFPEVTHVVLDRQRTRSSITTNDFRTGAAAGCLPKERLEPHTSVLRRLQDLKQSKYGQPGESAADVGRANLIRYGRPHDGEPRHALSSDGRSSREGGQRGLFPRGQIVLDRNRW